jgi:hypothetical protein
MIFGKESTPNQGKGGIPGFGGVEGRQDELKMPSVKMSGQAGYGQTLSWVASMDTASLNFPKQTRAS